MHEAQTPRIQLVTFNRQRLGFAFVTYEATSEVVVTAKGDEELLLIPLFTSFHWVLVVVDALFCTVHVVDSKGVRWSMLSVEYSQSTQGLLAVLPALSPAFSLGTNCWATDDVETFFSLVEAALACPKRPFERSVRGQCCMSPTG